MTYFNPFNYVVYPNFQDPTQSLILKNITTRVVRKLSLIDDQTLYYDYTMSDHQSLESISQSLYGSPDYYWIFQVLNNRYDRFYDFVLSQDQFNSYINDKYGSVAAASTQYKYYLKLASPSTVTIEVNAETYNNSANAALRVIPATDMVSWESEQNELKRTFKVLQNKYLQQFVKLFAALANE